jgi:phosphoribosyl 1,2-cyclic phosphodiesterase
LIHPCPSDYHAALRTNPARRRTVLEFCALASGSKGNAVYVGSEGRGVLVDVGLPAREVLGRLTAAGLSPDRIEAVVVTHEHRDHISGVGVWARRFRLPVFAARSTWEAADRLLPAGALRGVDIEYFDSGCPFEAGSLGFEPIPTSHDAAGSFGFRVSSGRDSLGFATDLGFASPVVRERLRDVRILYLESNHDEERLALGPYPWHLKQRIRSGQGHLSNAESAALLGELVHGGLETVILGHLSETNNTPRIAFAAAWTALAARGAEADVTLLVARQDRPGRVVRLEG